MLNNILTRGVSRKPYFITIYGPPGVGKTTFGCRMPNPVFICTEEGLPENDDGDNVSRFPKPKTYTDVLMYLTKLRDEKHDLKTVVIDSLDHLEPMVFDQVCKDHNKDNIEAVLGGYGKGYTLAKEYWRQLFSLLNQLNDKMHVLLICHSRIKTFNDPSLLEPYDRHELKLREQGADLVRENTKALLFMNFKSVIEQGAKTRGLSTGKVTIYTQYRAHHEGKNRYNLPYEIGNEFKDFDDLVKSTRRSFEDMLSEVEGLKSKISDKAVIDKVNQSVEKAQATKDVAAMSLIIKRLIEITGG